MLEKTEESNVLLHFCRVAFMSSAALGMLIRVQKKCKEFEIALKLCNISPDISEVFKITGLNKVFDIQPDAADAMEAFKASGIEAPKEITSKRGGTSWFKGGGGGGLSGHYDEPRVRGRLSPCRSAGEHRQHGNRPGIALYPLRIHTAVVAAEPIESFRDRFLP